MKQRLDQAVASKGLVQSRSQAESFIKLGKVLVNGQVVKKPGYFLRGDEKITLEAAQQYVSRAGLKLASVAKVLGVDFKNKSVLDVGSSTGGFTDYALKHGAKVVYAVDVGTNQLHPSLRGNEKIKLFEKTDIRNFLLPNGESADVNADADTDVGVDIVVIDVSFISLREILPYIKNNLVRPKTQIVAMVKPQFEASRDIIHKGVIKNETVRRKVLRQFEDWAKNDFVIIDKRDSEVAGEKGNTERFYLLKPAKAKAKV